MTDDQLCELADKLMAVVADMPGDLAMEQLRVAFGIILTRTCAEPDAGLLAFAAAATRVVRVMSDAQATVEVQVTRPDRVTLYANDGAIHPFDVGEDGDGGKRATPGTRH